MTMVRLKTKTENAVNLASRVLAPLALSRLRRYIDPCEAASRVRSHISPGPYRSFRELSLAGSVDPVIWCPPTFVGAPGSSASTAIVASHCYFLPRGLLPPDHDREARCPRSLPNRPLPKPSFAAP